ncbi:winged helix-turn-helix domain-containing protein [Streptomyces sp. 8N706]|uniref:winged helix-turn-helix domain-containing protein n=1 Tax=Streptomyces sp. 8N706 TaxID=3457416 RepID=UPI003FD0A89C
MGLGHGPAAHGCGDQGWTLVRIAVLVGRGFPVRFSQPQLSRARRQTDFSVQVAVHRTAERDDKQAARPAEGADQHRQRGSDFLVAVQAS